MKWGEGRGRGKSLGRRWVTGGDSGMWPLDPLWWQVGEGGGGEGEGGGGGGGEGGGMGR